MNENAVDYVGERERLGGPTLFVNRFIIQNYPDSSIRLTFLEHYSSDAAISPSFRSALYIPREMVGMLAQALVDNLPPGSVTLPQVETEAKEK